MTNPIQDRERDRLFGADPLGLDGPPKGYDALGRSLSFEQTVRKLVRAVPIRYTLPEVCDAELEFAHHGGKIRRTIKVPRNGHPPGVILCGEGVYLLERIKGAPVGYVDSGRVILCYTQDEGGVHRVG